MSKHSTPARHPWQSRENGYVELGVESPRLTFPRKIGIWLPDLAPFALADALAATMDCVRSADRFSKGPQFLLPKLLAILRARDATRIAAAKAASNRQRYSLPPEGVELGEAWLRSPTRRRLLALMGRDH
jgi:hypothetical protein